MSEVFTDIQYYPHLPEYHDLVMVKIEEAEGSIGVYCSLVAYGPKVRGLLLASEVSAHRARNPLRMLTTGSMEVCVVNRTDGDQIDLSKRTVSDEDRKRVTVEWQNLRRISTILTASVYRVRAKYEEMAKEGNTTATCPDLTTQSLIEAFLWPVVYQGQGAEVDFAGPLEALLELSKNPEILPEYWPKLAGPDAPAWAAEVVEAVREVITSKFAAARAEVRGGFRLTCTGPAGIDGIKMAIQTGLKGQSNVSITLVQPPEFRLVVEDATEDAAQERAKKIIKRIAAAAKTVGGELKVPRELWPRSSTAKEE